MSEFNFTKEILDSTAYYTAFDARGNETTVFDSNGELFVMTNDARSRGRGLPKPVSSVKKQSKTLVALLEVIEQDSKEEEASKVTNPRYIAFTKSHGAQPNWVYMDFIANMKKLMGVHTVNGSIQNQDEFTLFIQANSDRYQA